MVEPGMIFEGRYEIESLLGAGGVGEVFKARQISTGQYVAVKVIRDSGVSTERRERNQARFRRETQICAELRHPNIVGLLDAGEMASGAHYSVFAYVPGEDLRKVLHREQRLTTAETVHLMTQVLDALCVAHGAGVVHRDLKPGNIMITGGGARRHATVLDFGVGALLKPLHDEALAQLTATEEFVGTPSYASPEQLRGRRPSPQSDLYAWGLVFLECLTGECVMRGNSVTEIALKQLGPEPIPIPPPWRGHPLGALLARALHKDVDRRNVTAESLLHEITSFDLSALTPEAVGALPTLSARAGDLADQDTIDPTPDSLRRAASSMFEWKHTSGERRQLTAICCSLGVVCDGDADLDVEDFDDALRRARELCRAAADQFGGRVRSGHGDRVFTYFGYPLAREDDPRRAVQSALHLVRLIAAQGQSNPGGRARAEVRVGVDTGLVIVRDGMASATGEDDIVGATPGIAAHLSTLAGPGEVLLSARTATLARRHVRLESRGNRLLAGLARPMEVFAAGEGGAGSETLETLLAGDATPMVGRGGEFAMAQTRWSQARAGEGQSVLVTGEAGIGKSRLTREFVRQVRTERARWLDVRCLANASHNALRPFAELFERLCGFQPAWDAPSRWAALESFLEPRNVTTETALPLLGTLLALEPSERVRPLDASAQKQREMTLDLLTDLLFGLTEEEPVALVVEDLHWADPTTIDLLGRLVERAPSAAICVWMTARPEFQSPWPPSALLPIHLSRLTPEAVAEMLTNLSGGSRFPQPVVDEIVRRADGVSLFVEELAQAIREAGVVQEVDGTLKQVRSLSSDEIPLTLRDLLRARLDRTGSAVMTAQVAAVIGREFAVDMLEAASSAPPEAVAHHLGVLRAADLVRQLWRREGQPPAYEFKHALIRDMAYASQLKADRGRIHGRVAAVLEERFPQIVQTRPDLLALHHAEAGNAREALGYAQKAGMAALARSANAEALQQIETARPWLGHVADSGERALLELGLNNVATPALMATGGWANDEIRRTVERSDELLREIVAPEAAFGPTYALTIFHHVARNSKSTLDLSDRLRRVADEAGDLSLRVAAAAVNAQTLWIAGDYQHSAEDRRFVEAHYDREAHAAHGAMFGIDSLAYAYVMRGQFEWFCGSPDAGLRTTLEGVEWARSTRHVASHALMMLYVLLIEVYREDRAAIVRVADEVLAMADRYGLPAQQAYAGIMRSWATGDKDALLQVLGFLGMLGCRLGLTFYNALPAYLDHDAGAYDAALERIDQSIALCDELGERYYEAELHRRRAATLLARDGAAAVAVEDALRKAIAVASAQGTHTLGLHAALDLARLLVDRGERHEARDLLAELAPKVQGGDDLAFLREARALLAELS